MDWIWNVLISLLVHCQLMNFISGYPTFPSMEDDDRYAQDGDNLNQDKNFEDSIQLLSSMLIQPWPPGMSPLVYLENDYDDAIFESDASRMLPETSSVDKEKRSRYHWKYQLKRQNKYSRYDAENRYMCLPSKDDVFRLLVALHETRQGSSGRTVHFCNRKRPAKAVFTNIRFLGK